MLNVYGYDLLGLDEKEGIRYVWKSEYNTRYIESAAFINRTKGREEEICGYTTSVSMGCALRTQGLQCTFCRTGQLLPFKGFLTYREIAKQNVFMVLSDMYCNDNKNLASKMREFAYMGQGEPGFSYSQVRLAIELTNKIMKNIGQRVYRHIFATCGIPEAIYNYKNDLKNFYTERVTCHLSLHAVADRSKVMPINKIYPIKETIKALQDVVKISGEKPCVGIMLFHHFKPHGAIWEYTNSAEEVENILDILDPTWCRLSFCEYNSSSEIGDAEVYPQEELQSVLEFARTRGFEVKSFSSYGKEKLAACGMLAGKKPDFGVSEKWKRIEMLADELIIKYS